MSDTETTDDPVDNAVPASVSAAETQTHWPNDVATIRSELESLVGNETMDKKLALAILKLHHRMESAMMLAEASHEKEVERLKHLLESHGLRAEVNVLSLRQKAFQTEVQRLQDENDVLKRETSFPPPSSKKR